MRGNRLLLIAILLGVAMVAGCATKAESQDPAALEGVEWALVQSSVSDVNPTGLGITAKFASGAMSGFSGVNSYSGPFSAQADGSFNAGPLAGTLMAGPAPLMAAEAAYLKLVDAADKFALSDGKLTLKTAEGATLTFEAAAPFELAGTSWTITGYNNGKQAVTGPATGSELTLVFGTDGSVSGNSGVNTFSGDFTVTGDKITIGPLATTKMAGSEELMAQETAYLAALQAGTVWEVANGVLITRDAQGAMQINAIPK